MTRGARDAVHRIAGSSVVAMSLTLVVMAAGIGSRFGGTKQLAEVGPAGEAFLDFSILDSAAAGIDRFVMIVRSDIEDDVRRHIDPRHPDLDITYVRQDDLGPPRAKPWGTGHAILASAPAVDGTFIACKIGTAKPVIFASIVGGLMLIATAFNLAMIPHPLWFSGLGIAGILIAAWLGMKLGGDKAATAA